MLFNRRGEVQMNALRRLRGPYVAFAVPVGAVSVLGAVVAFSKHQPSLFLGAGLAWIVMLPALGMMYRYKILWNEDEIRMYAFGTGVKTMRIGSIASLDTETSSPRELLQMQRPAQRIAIHGQLTSGESGVIDVSFRHFDRKSIEELVSTLKRRRPDLELPKAFSSSRKS